jgi:hypothetical protein
MRRLFRILLIAALPIVSACVSDRALLGSDMLPAEQRVKLIEAKSLGLGKAIYLAAVDGKGRGLGKVEVYELPPGLHTLSISAAWGTGGGGVVNRYDFVAGHTYSLHGEFGDSDHGRIPYRIWIMDDGTGQQLLPLR